MVSDILTPRLDGYEFVRRMREIGLAATPLIFYTATYHERAARALVSLRRGGVLTTPSPPNLTRDGRCGARFEPTRAGSSLDRPEFDQEHASCRLSFHGEDRRLEAERRMAAVLEVATELAGDRDPFTMLNTLCVERDI